MRKKAKIHLSTFLLLLLLPAIALAQPKVLEEDVVYLKNGSIIRGIIQEQIPRESLTIQTFDGTIFIFETTEIDKVVREPSQYTRIKVRYNGAVVPIQYIDNQEFYKGYGIGLSSNESDGNFTMQARAGYKWRHWLQTGLVSGTDPYNAGLIIPVAAEIRGDAFKKPVTPHYFLQGGYGIAANRSFRHRVFDGGLMYHAGVGLTIKTRTKVEYMISLGYKWQNTYQEFEETPPWFWTPDNQFPPEAVLVTGTRNYRRITFVFATNF